LVIFPEAKMNLNFDLAKPIYLQIVDEIKRAVARGELQPGARIPSLREMAEQIKVNPNTVQRAYQEMERLQLTETLRGQGVYIRNGPDLLTSVKNDMAQSALQFFIGEMATLGFKPSEILAQVTKALQNEERTVIKLGDDLIGR
jgi:GntR family transcriptional regulator